MKQGMSLTQLANELERQQSVKKDYIADSQAMTLHPEMQLEVKGAGIFGINDHARRQLATKLDIPMAYFQRLEEKHPHLLAENVNQLFQREPQRNMVRVLDGAVRGIMSDKYRPLDNFDLADAVLPILMEAKVDVVSCDITETKMYIKCLMPWLDRELPVPQGLKMGAGHNFFVRKITGAVTISNSENGAGMLSIGPGIFEKMCTNYATYKDEGYGKMHVGKRASVEASVQQYLSDETKRLEDATVWATVRDVLKATMDGRVMDGIVRKLVDARGDAIEGDPAKVVELFAKKNTLNETEKGGLLKHLVGAGEMTRYGLQWAVTRLAQDAQNYDRASELERMGGEVIELAKNDWKILAMAA